MVTENTAAGPEEKTPALKRVMGSKLLYFFVIGDILGTGIYALTGSVAGKVGGALVIICTVAAVVCLPAFWRYHAPT